MDFTKRCVGDFEARDWRRGENYFRTGAVAIIATGADGLAAEVQGSESFPYSVLLDWSEAGWNSLLVDCTCPRFEEVGLCKHIAATIMAAEAKGVGERVAGKTYLHLIPLDADADDFDDLQAYDADDDEWDDDYSDPRARGRGGSTTKARGATRGGTAAPKQSTPVWKKRLQSLIELHANELPRAADTSTPGYAVPREIWYLLDVTRSQKRGWLCLSLFRRNQKKNGTLGKFTVARLSYDDAKNLQSPEDRALLELMVGSECDSGYGYSYGSYASYYGLSELAITPATCDSLLPRLCASKRFGWLPDGGMTGDQDVRLLAWDDGPAWDLAVDVSKSSDGKQWELHGKLQRAADAAALSEPLALLQAGLVIFPDRIARFHAGVDLHWAATLKAGPLCVPAEHGDDLIEGLAQLPHLPRIDWPSELHWEEDRPTPRPMLTISKTKWEERLRCQLTVHYGDLSAAFGAGPHAWYDRTTRRAVRRDFDAEELLSDQLLAAGARRDTYRTPGEPLFYNIAPAKMPRMVAQLSVAGWQVEAEGRVIRRPGALTINVTSGVDWFDLEGTCDFGGVTASLPELLAALRGGDQYVRLDDGSQGMLPNEWLSRYAGLAGLGKAVGDRLRFLPTQAALIDALLAAQENQTVTVDQAFTRLREKLQSFEGIRPCNEPRTFVGELRQYQREGLGWLHFLDEFGFGGCLADDMGLGKTVQILALLEERRGLRAKRARALERANEGESSPGPSLVVVPRSLVFNWIEEARRFTPKLRVLNYTGLDRSAVADQLADYDLVVTTYGTVRRDIGKLRNCLFDHVILDEAQAIKNASSQAAKACRLLCASRRLAVTGTPVENHLGELWSLFEFLNPGMLGRQQKLGELFSASRRGGRTKAEAGNGQAAANGVAVLARALRPFLLRRTKQQVLSELPPKTEQTLYCELDGTQRALYDELREHYRRTLLERVNKVGVNKSKIQVLEALLRLRQAACHPGLLDKKKIDGGSAKLETLLEQLAEVIDEGHKALVFSQFTSLLAIVRSELDRRQIVYEYLDGRTVKRQAKVERFQSDPACPLFLISLKAGGQGLNLTAADYVFILDPWWNPAVEAQAVDRPHRIGQDRHVFAYRLIARDTVEEKILQLQDHKRGLAEAIVSADNSILRDLTADDLRLLFS